MAFCVEIKLLGNVYEINNEHILMTLLLLLGALKKRLLYNMISSHDRGTQWTHLKHAHFTKWNQPALLIQ